MAQQITRTMTFGQLIEKCPAAVPVLSRYGLHCIGCHIAVVESIEDGCRAHGLSDQQIDAMISEMNELA